MILSGAQCIITYHLAVENSDLKKRVSKAIVESCYDERQKLDIRDILQCVVFGAIDVDERENTYLDPGQISYKFRKQFDTSWFTGEVIEIRPGAGKFSSQCHIIIII